MVFLNSVNPRMLFYYRLLGTFRSRRPTLLMEYITRDSFVHSRVILSESGDSGLVLIVLCYNLTSKIKEIIMETLATTRMSSKGQVVIPESVRKRLNLKEGAQFLVVGDADVVILKVVVPPDMSEFDALIKQARKQAKEAGLKPADITSAIAKARGRK